MRFFQWLCCLMLMLPLPLVAAGKIDLLAAQLAQPDAGARLQAVQTLRDIRNPRVAPLLISALADPDPKVRLEAVVSLQVVRDFALISTVKPLLHDPDSQVALCAGGTIESLFYARRDELRTMYRYGDVQSELLKFENEYRESFLPMLHDERPETRRAVLAILQPVKDERVQREIARLLDDPDPWVRLGAVRQCDLMQEPRVLAVVLNAHKDPDPEIRIAALELLGQIRDYCVIDPLLASMMDPEVSVRKAAISHVQFYHDPRIFARLVDAVQDPDQEVKLTALEALRTRKDPRANAVFAKCFHDAAFPFHVTLLVWLAGDDPSPENPYIKQAMQSGDILLYLVAIQLSRPRMLDDGLVPLLHAALKSTDEKIRKSAENFLQHYHDSRMLEDLLPLLKDPDERIRVLVRENILYLTQRAYWMDFDVPQRSTRTVLWKAVQDTNPFLRNTALRALGQLGDMGALDKALELLADPDQDTQQTAVAVIVDLYHQTETPDARLTDAYRKIPATGTIAETSSLEALERRRDPDVIPLLIERLHDENDNVREWAAQQLYRRGEKSVDALLPELKNPDARIRALAVSALSWDEGNNRGDRLLAAIQTDDRMVYCGVLEALSKHRPCTDAAARYFRIALRDLDPSIRRIGAQGLDGSSNPVDVKALCAALNDKDPSVRITAIRSLGKSSQQKWLPALIPLASDAEIAVRLAALWALSECTDARVLPILRTALHDTHPEVRSVAMSLIMYKQDRASVHDAMRMIHDPDAAIRRNAVAIIGRYGDRSVIPLLLTMLNDEQDLEVRLAVAEVMGRFNDARVANAYLKMINDPHFRMRQCAVRVLGTLKSKAIENAFIERLKIEQFSSIRLLLVAALKDSPDPRAIALVKEAAYERRFDEERLDTEFHGE